MRLSDFDYPLPLPLIAQEPANPRDASRLLSVSSSGGLKDAMILNLPDLLRAGDVLVLNNTKVIPAQLFAQKNNIRIGITLLKLETSDCWECFAKPARRARMGDTLEFGEGVTAQVVARHESGTLSLRFNVAGSAFFAALDRIGQMPLPPYIRRESKVEADFTSYQTLHANKPGAVAAPTAGLHFTERLMQVIREKGVEIQQVTLHVGGGTFLPVRSEDVSQHVMHREWMEIDEPTAAALNAAKAQGRRIISIGTTALRCLESAADEVGTLHAQQRETGIFITPGYKFRMVDALVTNFHLPKSTLFMLVSAFSGLETMQAAYAHAIAQRYRFFSYGDACFLERASWN